MRRRVVITGLGVVTSLGETVDEYWEALCAGRSGIKTITRWDASKFPVRFGGECTSFDVTKYGIDFRGSGGSQRSEWDVRDELTGGDGLGHSNGGEPRPHS